HPSINHSALDALRTDSRSAIWRDLIPPTLRMAPGGIVPGSAVPGSAWRVTLRARETNSARSNICRPPVKRDLLSLMQHSVPAVLAAMLDGWGRQQRARFLQDRTIGARARLVRRLAEFSGQYPWQWNAAEMEAFFGSLRCGGRPAAASTARGYQVTLRLFLDY